MGGGRRAPWPEVAPAGTPGAARSEGETGRDGETVARQQAASVLARRQAIVIGPTPPGTGVIAPATGATLAKSTSPAMTGLPSGPGTRLIPTSITVAPGLTQVR